MGLAGIAAAVALAQGEPPTQPPPPAPERASGVEPAAPATGSGIIVYPPSFFAESRPANALDMVNRLPGFTLESVDTTVRGFAGSAGNALVDGQRPATKSDQLSDVLARIPASAVERIELIRGGAPGVDMQGKSVVVNVVRRRVDSFQQLLSGTAFWFLERGTLIGGYRYEATRQSGPRTYEVAFGRGISYDDSVGGGFRERRGPGGELISFERAGTEGDGGGNNGKATIKTPLFGGELRANLSASHSIFKGEDHYASDVLRTDVVEKDDNFTGELGVNYDRDLSERWRLETVALHKVGVSQFIANEESGEDRSRFISEADSGESILRGLLRWRRSETLSFEAGGEAAFNFREGTARLTVNGTPEPIPSADVRVEERRGEAFVLGTWRPRPRLTVEAGSRFEHSTISQTGDTELERSFFYPKPRLLLTWSPTEADQLRFRVEREVGQLRFSDFVSSSNLADDRLVAGNPDLEPEKSWVYEAAAERRFWEGGAIVLLLRHRDVSDVIDRTPVFVDDDGDGVVDRIFDSPGNIGDGTRDELEFNLTLPLARLGVDGGEFKASVILRDSEVIDPATLQARRISGLRHDNINLSYRHDLPARKLTFELGYFGGWEEIYYRFNEVARFEIRDWYEAAVEYKPTPKLNFRLEVLNIDPYVFVRQREFYGGLRGSAPVSLREHFETTSQTHLMLRLRRTFGG
jgi:outer membrane receptor protein involved in Fe transport